jgi:hypothetical protein
VFSLVFLISFWIIVYHGGVLVEGVVEEVDVSRRMNELREKQHAEVTKRSHGIGRLVCVCFSLLPLFISFWEI